MWGHYAEFRVMESVTLLMKLNDCWGSDTIDYELTKLTIE